MHSRTERYYIIMVEDDLSTYLIRPEVISALDPELQAEIRFGSENSQDGTYADMIENVRCFLDQDQDDTWRDQAEPQLAEYRRDTTQMSSVVWSSHALLDSSPQAPERHELAHIHFLC